MSATVLNSTNAGSALTGRPGVLRLVSVDLYEARPRVPVGSSSPTSGWFGAGSDGAALAVCQISPPTGWRCPAAPPS